MTQPQTNIWWRLVSHWLLPTVLGLRRTMHRFSDAGCVKTPPGAPRSSSRTGRGAATRKPLLRPTFSMYLRFSLFQRGQRIPKSGNHLRSDYLKYVAAQCNPITIYYGQPSTRDAASVHRTRRPPPQRQRGPGHGSDHLARRRQGQPTNNDARGDLARRWPGSACCAVDTSQ